jgi:hypothetical protein
MPNIAECKSALETLKNNPFTLIGLSDKEKFHTGMIAFAMRRYRDFAHGLFPVIAQPYSVDVEHRFIDLVVKNENTFIAAAEVKLKTDLHDEQLEKIQDKLPNGGNGAKRVIGLFEPVNPNDKKWMTQHNFLWVSLTDFIPNLLVTPVKNENDTDIASLMRFWKTYLQKLQVVRSHFEECDIKAIAANDKDVLEVSQMLDKIKLKGIFEAYRCGLVCNGIPSIRNEKRNFIGNTRGNAQIHLEAGTLAGYPYGLQWQGESLKLFLKGKGKGDVERDSRLTTWAKSVNTFVKTSR